MRQHTVATLSAVVGLVQWSACAGGAATGDGSAAAAMENAAGVLVLSVEGGSQAEAAGLEAGDVILEYDGVPTPTIAVLQSLIAKYGIGSGTHLVVQRAGGIVTVSVGPGALGIRGVDTRIDDYSASQEFAAMVSYRLRALSVATFVALIALAVGGVAVTGSRQWPAYAQAGGGVLMLLCGAVLAAAELTGEGNWTWMWPLELLGTAGQIVFAAGYVFMAFGLRSRGVLDQRPSGGAEAEGER